ncbi:damage-control phosphatase ARMT1 family protein [Pseudobacteroides cellulosolvens]|uniref:Damage-control phosphatase ARMT1-like metal-binding domain-containing protein n=1 Tax=Pseudobacteroides cellulosolvens ATCC 35603 = DSM 2933 TaxID=398512 RepID=A0A0L6JUG5_9FIRM|nr:ARMT1-like domain-containing protein [Pseudobacteroides cellulosolvens]KNY29463.1 protein of unknown function DUF89 [Pseudobacteroides cellulosolvens ATCC 35603 = DSM 2933]
MEIQLDCLPCFLRQVLDASRMATHQLDIQKAIIIETAKLIQNYEEYRYSPSVGREMHSIVKKYTGVSDPYKDVKVRNIKTALSIYPSLKYFLFKTKDRLYWALKIAATGNIIDSAIYNDIDVESRVGKELDREFAVCDIDRFEKLLKNCKTLLIIADNAGETVFDRVLIEELLYLNIIYAVRSEPIINDATAEDVYASDFNRSVKVVSSGCNAPGTIIEECSDEFLEIYNNADIVISKGQGNFETLSEQKREIFFLLKAKCPIVADRLGVYVGDYVLKSNNHGE